MAIDGNASQSISCTATFVTFVIQQSVQYRSESDVQILMIS